MTTTMKRAAESEAAVRSPKFALRMLDANDHLETIEECTVKRLGDGHTILFKKDGTLAGEFTDAAWFALRTGAILPLGQDMLVGVA